MEENPPTPPSRPADSRLDPHRSKTRRMVIWVVVLLVAVGLFLLILRTQNTPQKAAQLAARGAAVGPVSVISATARKDNIGVYLEAIGTVTPVHTSSITSQITGLVMAVHYREGQLVHKGDVLIEIDPRSLEAQLTQAEGTLEKDTQLLAQATMDLERYRAAWAQNAIPKQTLDDQEKIVLQDQGTVKADQGTVQYDKVQLLYCRITAPFSGRVGLRLIDPGNVVQANGTNPLVVITQEQPITVIFAIAEDALDQVQSQLRHGAHLTVDAFDRTAEKKIASGKLLSLDNQIDTTTGTVKLRATFDNKNDLLFPNQFVNARLLVKTLNGVTLIPTAAIQHNGETSFVYVIQNGIAQMRVVKPGVANAGMTSVEGVQPGEIVANSSFEKLRPNAPVVIAPAKPSGGNNGSSAQ